MNVTWFSLMAEPCAQLLLVDRSRTALLVGHGTLRPFQRWRRFAPQTVDQGGKEVRKRKRAVDVSRLVP